MRSLLSCHSCLWHCLRAVAHRSLLAQPTALARNRHLLRLRISSHGRRTYAAARQSYNYRPPKTYEENWHAYAQDEGAKNTNAEALEGDEDQPNQRPPMRIRLEGAERDFNYNGTVSNTMRKNVKREIQWLGDDSKKVADHTLKCLNKGEEEKALMIAREASPRMDCTVAWNHIINHFMRKGHDKLALKAFNEMKKRGQKPDYYTYSLVLIGISNNMDKPQALTNAMAVYYSMSAPNSSKQPTILHTNLFLKVCAKAQAFDQLWAVAGRIPDSGPGSADGATYSIILNALKTESEHQLRDSTTEDHQRRMDKAAADARKIWADIVSKWRAHTLVMDEQLVLAMGQILLNGSRPREHDDVFSLVEQTTGIPRMTPRISVQPDPAQTPQEGAFNVPARGAPKHNIAPGQEFDLVKPPRSVGGMHRQTDLVKPSNITLTLLMTACLKTMAKQAADKYWSILTGPDSYGIEPDEPSIKAYLRVLRVFRSSADAVELVQTHIVDKNMRVTPAMLRIAMSTCARDSKNKNSLDHATALLKIMERKMPDADATTVGAYLSRVFDAVDGADVLKGLEQVEPIYRNLRSMLTYGKYQGSMLDESQRQAIFLVMKRMQSCYDRLLNKAEVPKSMYAELGQKKSEITAFLTRAFDKDMVRRGYDRDLVKEKRDEKERERKVKQRLKQGIIGAEKPAFKGERPLHQHDGWDAKPRKSMRQDIIDRKRSRAKKSGGESGW